MIDNNTRRYVDPLGYYRRENDPKRKGGIKRKKKLNRFGKSPVSYSRRFIYKSSKLNTGRTKYIFMYRYKAVIRFLADRNNITPNQMEFLTACYSYDYFIISEILDVCFIPQSFIKKEWGQLIDAGFIQVYKTQKRAEGLPNIYRLSYKGNKLVARFYKMMLGEEDFPEYAK